MHTLFLILSVSLCITGQLTPGPSATNCPMVSTQSSAITTPSASVKTAVWVGDMYDIYDPATDDYAGCSTNISDVYATLSEAHYYAVEWVNDNLLNGTGVTLETHVIDTCASDMIGLQRSTYLAQHEGICRYGTRGPNQIYALLGGTISDNAKMVSNLMRAFCVRLFASLSTNTELYPYFLRCVPSDSQQALAIVHILQHFNWTTVNFVSEKSSYGTGLHDAFEKHTDAAEICVKNDLTVNVDKLRWDSVSYLSWGSVFNLSWDSVSNLSWDSVSNLNLDELQYFVTVAAAAGVQMENYTANISNISDRFPFCSTGNVMFPIVNALAAMGVVLCLASGLIVHWHINTPVFKATGGSLNYVVVITVLAVFASIATTCATPSVISCGVGWAVLSLAITMCLGVAVLRLHIYHEVCTNMPGSYVICERYFKDNHLRMHALLLVLGVQVLIVVCWGILWPPVTAVLQMKSAVGYVRICASQFEVQTLVLLFIPALLLCIAFVYSYNLLNSVLYFFQREARIILRSCTCIALLGLVLVPLLVSNDNFDQEQKLVGFQLWCTLLGFSMILTLVLPDVYLAVFKPNRNDVSYIRERRPLNMQEWNPGVFERFYVYTKNCWASRTNLPQRDEAFVSQS